MANKNKMTKSVQGTSTIKRENTVIILTSIFFKWILQSIKLLASHYKLES